jgi:hypothetical protein
MSDVGGARRGCRGAAGISKLEDANDRRQRHNGDHQRRRVVALLIIEPRSWVVLEVPSQADRSYPPRCRTNWLFTNMCQTRHARVDDPFSKLFGSKYMPEH